MSSYYLLSNDEEKCWELRRRNVSNSNKEMKDAVIARFYDGNNLISPIGEMTLILLQQGEEDAFIPTRAYASQRDTRRPGKHWRPSLVG
jgi:hypothetical protein